MIYNDDQMPDDYRFIYRKGLFWIISHEEGGDGAIVYTANCDENGIADENAPPYNSKNRKSYAHKNTWSLVCGEYRDKPWNYYPRGRVEIAKGKATVYHNPLLTNYPNFQRFIIGYFRLEGFSPRSKQVLPVRFIPDFSKHYESIYTDIKQID